MEPRPIRRLRRLEPVPAPRGPLAFDERDFGTLDLAATLLVFQAALGLVSAAGVIFLGVLSGGHPLYVLASIAALMGPGLAILFARGLTRARRWARNWTIAYEALILAGVAVRVFFVRELAFGLVISITSIVLPLVVTALVLSPTARAAVRATSRPKIKKSKKLRRAKATPLAPIEPLRPAA
jgi:hypothetical protein